MRVLTGEHVGGDGVQALLVVTVAAVPASGDQPWLASGSLFGIHATAPSSPWVPGSGSLGDQGRQGRPAGVAVINAGALVAGLTRVGKWGRTTQPVVKVGVVGPLGVFVQAYLNTFRKNTVFITKNSSLQSNYRVTWHHPR
jgi:hypothetical protein